MIGLVHGRTAKAQSFAQCFGRAQQPCGVYVAFPGTGYAGQAVEIPINSPTLRQSAAQGKSLTVEYVRSFMVALTQREDSRVVKGVGGTRLVSDFPHERETFCLHCVCRGVVSPCPQYLSQSGERHGEEPLVLYLAGYRYTRFEQRLPMFVVPLIDHYIALVAEQGSNKGFVL